MTARSSKTHHISLAGETLSRTRSSLPKSYRRTVVNAESTNQFKNRHRRSTHTHTGTDWHTDLAHTNTDLAHTHTGTDWHTDLAHTNTDLAHTHTGTDLAHTLALIWHTHTGTDLAHARTLHTARTHTHIQTHTMTHEQLSSRNCACTKVGAVW